jgi:phosphatidate cytidylyltransferase
MPDEDNEQATAPDESIFELFGDPPPEPDPKRFGPVPVVRPDELFDDEPLPTAATPAATPADDDLTLPHWSEPATGQVPKVLAGDRPDEGDAWSNVAGPRWRGEEPAWADTGDLNDVFAEELGLAPPGREPAGPAGEGDGSDEDLDAPLIPPVASDRNLTQAIVVGVAFAAIAALAFLDTATSMALVAAVAFLCALELFKAMQDGGLRPATLLGITAAVALPLAVYARGEAAYPLVLFLLVVFGALWYLVGADHHRPVANLGATMFGVVYIGGLAGFGALLLRFPNGIGMVLAAVIATVAADVGAYVAGRTLGRHHLSRFSPGKTWEGTIGGVIAAVLASFLFVGLLLDGITPFGGEDGRLIHTVWLGLVIGVVAPLGDLTESLIKRDLGLKDMGSILPGHGGMLDRVDALLFALPATYYLARILELS